MANGFIPATFQSSSLSWRKFLGHHTDVNMPPPTTRRFPSEWTQNHQPRLFPSAPDRAILDPVQQIEVAERIRDALQNLRIAGVLVGAGQSGRVVETNVEETKLTAGAAYS